MQHKLLGALLALPCLLLAGPGVAEDVCSDFNDNTLQGWHAEAATASVSSPGADGTPYMRCGDLSSPPTSAIIAPAIYTGSWADTYALEFDLILHDDGWQGEAHALSPVLHLKASVTEGLGERTVFVVDWPVSDPDGTSPGWHHIVAPVHPAMGGSLPANEYGHREVPTPLVDPETDWNALLENVELFCFIADIAGSPMNFEDFGLDNICRKDIDPVATTPVSWGEVKSKYGR